MSQNATKQGSDAYWEHIRKVVDQAPPLSPAQRDMIAVLFKPNAPSGGADLEAAVERQRLQRERDEQEKAEARRRAEEARRAAARRCAVYRHFDCEGRLLYVGISANTAGRRGEHLSRAAWTRFQAAETVEWFPDRATAEQAERVAIQAEQPIFNIVGAAEGARERRIKYIAEQGAWEMLTDK